MRLSLLALTISAACLLAGGCGPVAAQAGPRKETHGDITYACRHGGGLFDGWFCRAQVNERIHLFVPEFHGGPFLDYFPYGGNARSVEMPEKILVTAQSADGPVQIMAPPRTWVTEAAETDRYLIAHISDDTWRLVERPPADAQPVRDMNTLREGPFTRAELEVRMAGAPFPPLVRVTDPRK